MTEFSFYQVTVDFQRALCQVIDKCYQTGMHSLVHTAHADLHQELDKKLWGYGRKTFIPHGSSEDERHGLFPVLLSPDATNANNAEILLLTAPDLEIDYSYKRVIIIFDGNDDSAVSVARNRYKELKELGHKIKFYFQDKKGTWQLHAPSK